MERLILFARAPVLGKVKTRLTPTLTPQQVLRLYRGFLRDQVAFVAALARASRELELCLDAAPRGARIPRGPGVRLTLQGEGDLGERLVRALRRANDDGCSRAVVVGADSPSLPAAIVEEAFARLAAGADAVVSPADDGGFVLVGTREPYPALFRQIPWGGPDVLETTLDRARGAGLVLATVPGWHDVDTPADLERLAADLDHDPARAPATLRELRRLAL